MPVGTEDARDFVAGSSSPAAPSRSSRTVARTARRCCMRYCENPQHAPEKVMARRASIMITASPLGEEEAVPSGRGAKGVAVPPWKRREAG
ncbi:MAG TPA: hypothetical protein PKJ91_00440 [Methanoregulaceae archaeon]|nr:hypothetical protein [Methanoregulaceae archaeon]